MKSIRSSLQFKILLASASEKLGLADDEVDFLGNIIESDDLDDFDFDQGDPVSATMIYRTQQDSKVDDVICLPLQNQEYEFDDPTRPIIPDDTHPNCRCFWELANNGKDLGQDGIYANAKYGSISKATTEFADMVDGKEGAWKTVKGTPVFFPDGEDPSDAISKAFKGKSKSKAPTKQAPKSKEPLRFSEARKKHQEFLSNNKGESYSYDPITGKGYNAFDKKEGLEMYNRYDISDGKDPVYFISETNHQGQLSRESESAFVNVTNQGDEPIIGRWISDDTGFDYTDISYAESGLGKKGSDREIRLRLKEAGQESALKLFPDGTVDFVNA